MKFGLTKSANLDLHRSIFKKFFEDLKAEICRFFMLKLTWDTLYYDGCSVHATIKIFGLATQTENDIISKGTFIFNQVRKITRLAGKIHFTFPSIRQNFISR